MTPSLLPTAPPNKEEEYEEDGTGDRSQRGRRKRGPRLRRFSTSNTTFSTFSFKSKPYWVQKIKEFVFPLKEDVDSFVPNYRHTPIISGVIIPFSILLEIPGLTEHWYIRTENNNIVESRKNPIILDVGLGISVACAVFANIALIMRFLEKRVKTMTLFCIMFLTIHDLINIAAVTVFGVAHRFNDGFTYGQSFWMTVCSTAVSTLTNLTIIYDFVRTKNFNNSGSGLTRKQRSLVIIIMILFCYICIGALVNSVLIDLSFINGLYFTLVTIETIGFGDIAPKTTGARIFVLAYAILGIMNIGVAIGMCRETVLEAMEVGYRKRVKIVRERRKEGRRRRRVEARWRHGIEWRLREMGQPVWVRDDKYKVRRQGGGGRGGIQRVNTGVPEAPNFIQRIVEWSGIYDPEIGHSHVMHGPSGMRLNLQVLTHAQLEASALEAGVPLETLLPEGFVPAQEETPHAEAHVESDSTLPGWAQHPLASALENAFHPAQARSLTHARLGAMSALLTRFAVAAIHTHATTADELAKENAEEQHDGDGGPKSALKTSAESGAYNPDHDHHADHHDFSVMQKLERQAFYAKLIVAWSLFITFWVIGSAIFMQTEGWSYGVAMYFCFVSFTTIGYGDFSPQTPAGRSVFVVWALMGVGTLTILISVVQEAYDNRYKSALHAGAFDKAVKRYRQRADAKRPVKRTTTGVPYTRTRTLTSLYPREHSVSHSTLGHHRNHPIPPGSNAETPRRSASPIQMPDITEDHVADSHARAQNTLEALPGHVLDQAKTFHKYIKFFVDGGNILDAEDGGSGSRLGASGGMYEVADGLRRLLDEVAGMGGLGKVTKEELLQDEQARHTLFMLSIETALHKMIDAAEDAMDCIAERNTHAAQFQQASEGQDKPDTVRNEVASTIGESSMHTAEEGSIRE